MPIFYCDGSCDNRNKPLCPGGTGWVRVLKNNRVLRQESRAYNGTTNNRMELLAVIHALESLRRPSRVEIVSDSMITIMVGRKLASSAPQPPQANLDLWLRYYAVARQHRITFRHVRGHRGDLFNEMADKLAGQGYDLSKALDPKSTRDDHNGCYSETEDKNSGAPKGTPLRKLFG